MPVPIVVNVTMPTLLNDAKKLSSIKLPVLSGKLRGATPISLFATACSIMVNMQMQECGQE
jgi:hypothetical protein